MNCPCKPTKAPAFRVFLAVTLLFASIQAFSATLTLEGFSYNPITKRLSEISHNIDLYANGIKVISDSLCTIKEPCKVEIQKKSILTLCGKTFEGVCQTSIVFEPSDSQKQRFAYIFSTSTYFAHYTVYRPEEIPVIDGFLKKQGDDEKQINEMLNKAPN